MFTIDLSPIIEFTGLPIFRLISYSIIGILVIYFIFLIIRWIWKLWVKHVQGKYKASQEYILLRINVPKDNEQGPEAAEKMFAHFAGIKKPRTWRDKYLHGKLTLSISLEIVSIEGRIQFLIRTPIKFRELVESAIYASYPDAEIIEEKDYTEDAPEEFPDEDYNLWGADLILYNDNPYPIRTYRDFEQGASKQFNDPLIDFLEILSRMNQGEQVWLQIIITPIGQNLRESGKNLIQKLGGEVKQKKSIISDIIETSQIMGPSSSTESKKQEFPTLMKITPGERAIIESVEKKIAKIAFNVRIRFIYLAEHDVFSKDKGVSGTLGALNQFNTLDMNGLKPDDKAKVDAKAIRSERNIAKRQTWIINAYKKRNPGSFLPKNLLQKINKYFSIHPKPGKNYQLNIEELASLYHFPVTTTKVPSIKKTSFRKGEPPIDLPTK